MNELLRFHHDWAYGTILINASAGIWMLISLKYKQLCRKKYFLWPVYFGWLAVAIQVFLGISLYMNDYHVEHGKGFHYFYGFIALMTASVLFSYRNSLGSKKVLIYGISSLFLAGLGIRTALIVLL